MKECPAGWYFRHIHTPKEIKSVQKTAWSLHNSIPSAYQQASSIGCLSTTTNVRWTTSRYCSQQWAHSEMSEQICAEWFNMHAVLLAWWKRGFLCRWLCCLSILIDDIHKSRNRRNNVDEEISNFYLLREAWWILVLWCPFLSYHACT